MKSIKRKRHLSDCDVCKDFLNHIEIVSGVHFHENVVANGFKEFINNEKANLIEKINLNKLKLQKDQEKVNEENEMLKKLISLIFDHFVYIEVSFIHGKYPIVLINERKV